ncbi:hypothetical protein [Burkholderia cenocepacia]|uniref:hypothetical protein n=1 Tax=Burkholderia cenocepacia TaxID=95486 RepID=UPI0012378080|nr:hypothetical protein [Burkholderia cenocepacia]
MAEAVAPPPNCGIISIKTPFAPDANLQAGWAETLRLAFFDEDAPSGPEVESGTIFAREAANRILDFVDAHPALDELVVHCDLGISRSAAVAILLGEYLHVPVFRQGAPVDPRYRQHNAHVYRVLYNAVCERMERDADR